MTDFDPATSPAPTHPTSEEFAALRARVEALEAWTCRRPGDAIPQPFIDKIAADAIASVTPPVEPEEPEQPVEPVEPEEPVEEVPDGSHEDSDVPSGE